MRRLYKAALHLILLLNISFNVHGSACLTMNAKETAPSMITHDVWDRIGEFCDVETLKNLSLCSHDIHTYPQQHLRELKERKDGDGMMVLALFGNLVDSDAENSRRLKSAGLLDFEKWDYQKIVNLFIDVHTSLTGSQKELLKNVLLPIFP